MTQTFDFPTPKPKLFGCQKKLGNSLLPSDVISDIISDGSKLFPNFCWHPNILGLGGRKSNVCVIFPFIIAKRMVD